eukprot:TRINITY_DN419_c1_g2_i3.p1 TRINITY_DN419_c1_g2~~TRINITY_DN419_c1_g2_i3.p1  ORF type:complete len:128 (-),score=5.52 TRINITY_DN419_c1_g2_i3:365-748(-)
MWEYVWVGAACFGVCAAGVGTSIGVHARRVQSLGRGLRGLARGGVAGAADLVPAVVHAVQTTDGLLALWTACQGPDLSDSVASSDPSPTATATTTATATANRVTHHSLLPLLLLSLPHGALHTKHQP